MTERNRLLLGFVVAPVVALVCYFAFDAMMFPQLFIDAGGSDLIRLLGPLGVALLRTFYIWTIALGLPAHLTLRRRVKRSAAAYRLIGVLVAALPVIVATPFVFRQDFMLRAETFRTGALTEAIWLAKAAACGLAAGQAFWWIAVRPADGRRR